MEPLTDAEAELWQAWLAANDALAQVTAEVATATGLSEPDLAVLTRLQDVGGGRLRQSELVDRDEVPGGVEVRLTTMGRAALHRAKPVHADAVRRHLVQALPARDRERLLTILRRISPAVSPAPGS